MTMEDFIMLGRHLRLKDYKSKGRKVPLNRKQRDMIKEARERLNLDG